MAKLGFLLICAGLLAVFTEVSGQNNSPLPPDFIAVQPFGKRVFEAGCADSRTRKIGCTVSCPKKCPDECLVFCPTCRTLCSKWFLHDISFISINGNCASLHSVYIDEVLQDI